MSTVEEIITAIKKLDQLEQARLAEWFWHHDDDDWDRQMRGDIAAGKLNHLIRQTEEDIKAGRVHGLPGDPDVPPRSDVNGDES